MLVYHNLECSKCGRVQTDVSMKIGRSGKLRIPRCRALGHPTLAPLSKAYARPCRGKQDILWQGRAPEFQGNFS